MSKYIFRILIIAFPIFFLQHYEVNANSIEPLTLNESIKKYDMYPSMEVVKDYEMSLTIDDVFYGEYKDQFLSFDDIEQSIGFFSTANWLRFEVTNSTADDNWLLEFAFPLINTLELYEEKNGDIELMIATGSDLPFDDREIDHRHFIFNLNLAPGETKTYYALAVGSGDLHPPINIWHKDSFIEKTQKETLLLGLFYGISLVMIIYNLFLYFGLRIKSYLYYVMAISFTLLGKVSINGLGYQFLWPNVPKWNIVSAPVWVPLACVFILIFTRSFLELKNQSRYINWLFFLLMFLNLTVILTLPISRYLSLFLMVSFSIVTFLVVLTVAFICLIRGVREARFYILGWLIFLTGVSITILERAVILPYTTFTEYAGQAALTIEVVLLSLALADKINIMRQEKEVAEQKAKENQNLAIQNLKKADELKDEFLAITSHELRTPLYGMIGIAESLRDGAAGDVSEKMHLQLSMMIKSGRRLSHLVNEILDFSKLKYDSLQLQLAPVHINGVLDIVLTIAEPLTLNKSIKIVNEIDKLLPPIFADKNRLQQILYNLIDNAIKYTEKGTITISAVQKDDQLTIKVQDTGYGIPKENLDKIFKPFQQGSESLSRKASGVGIGLNITKNLVELHKGKLTVKSEIGEGSTFYVTLPLYQDKYAKGTVPVPVTPLIASTDEIINIDSKVKRNDYKILIADDEMINIQVLVNHLGLEGYHVSTAIHGKDVFELINKNTYDLVILDIMMPDISGYDICKKLRETHSLMELPILMLTAKGQVHDKMLAFQAGANDYLVKPTDKQELLSRVKTLLEVKSLNEELKQINLHLEEKVSERTHDLKIAHENLVDMEASRRQLLANIAHELGNPIALINNYIQSLQKGLIDIDDKHYEKLVKDKINMLDRLIEDLYDLSIIESQDVNFDYKEIRLNEWLTNVYERCQLIVKQENRQFRQHSLPSAVENFMAKVDIERMDQVFLNLISNAVKNTDPDKGMIEIQTRLEATDTILIKVIDNGKGISKENLPYIFDRFFKKSHSNQQGLGLGLAIVKQIVQSHGGEIWAESVKNNGATFNITLPISLQEREKRIAN